jgi:hypothetical protein
MILVAMVCLALISVYFKYIFVATQLNFWEDVYARGMVMFIFAMIQHLMAKQSVSVFDIELNIRNNLTLRVFWLFLAYTFMCISLAKSYSVTYTATLICLLPVFYKIVGKILSTKILNKEM